MSPDGTHVAVGGPNDPLNVASTADFAFEPVSDVAPLCLKWGNDGLFACADEAKAGFSLALSTDSGIHFSPRFHKPELMLKACPVTLDTGLYCPQAWEGQKDVLGIDAGAPKNEPAGATGAVPSPRENSGCSLPSGSQAPATRWPAWLGLVLLWARRKPSRHR